MKKITFLSFLFMAVLASKAQTTTTLFSDDFNDEDISDWTLYDEDGDGQNWLVVQIQDANGNPERTPVVRSFSYDNTAGSPLTPDNYFVSPEIDLTGENGSEPISLQYDVSAADASFSDEKYSVYIASSGNAVSDFMNGTELLTELVTDNGPGGFTNPYTKTLDITSFAGSKVYIAFRHHDVSDEFSMEIDNVKVISGNLSVENQTFNGFKHYVANGNLNLSARTPMENLQIFNLTGQQIMNKKLTKTRAQIGLNGLSAGVYISRITINDSTKSFKFVKK